MTKPIQNLELDHAIEKLCAIFDGPPGPFGTVLLRRFAETSPTDFAFLEPEDMVDLRNSGFTSAPEWGTFAEHYASCESCNA